jgi:hypothetical protein
MRRPHFFPVALALLLCLCATASAQTQTFSDDNVDFTFELPSPTWRLVARPDDVRATVEFVYGDRSDGYLRVRKETTGRGASTDDIARQDQDQKLRFRPGYVEGKQERFAGNMSGTTTSYEFTSGGKPMLGRVYYLSAPDGPIYTLHFTGARDKLSRIRNQTDSIARTLKQK